MFFIILLFTVSSRLLKDSTHIFTSRPLGDAVCHRWCNKVCVLSSIESSFDFIFVFIRLLVHDLKRRLSNFHEKKCALRGCLGDMLFHYISKQIAGLWRTPSEEVQAPPPNDNSPSTPLDGGLMSLPFMSSINEVSISLHNNSRNGSGDPFSKINTFMYFMYM